MYFGDPEFVADFGCHLKQDFGQDRGKSFLLKSRCKCNLAIFLNPGLNHKFFETAVVIFEKGRQNEPKQIGAI